MNKAVSLLTASILVLSIVSVSLIYQIVIVENKNSELKKRLFDVNAQFEQKRAVSFQLETQISELEEHLRNNTNKVKITEFRFEGFAFPPVSATTYCSDYIVTVENFGINAVENLTVVFDGDYFDGYQHHDVYRFNPDRPYKWSLEIGTLKAGESKTVHQIHVIPEDSTFVIQLMMNDVVLDKK